VERSGGEVDAGGARRACAMLGPRGIDRWGSYTGESTGGAGSPCDVNGDPDITNGSTGYGGRTTVGGL